MMTEDELAAIEARANAGWQPDTVGGPNILTNAREDIQRLIAEIRRLRAEK